MCIRDRAEYLATMAAVAGIVPPCRRKCWMSVAYDRVVALDCAAAE